MMRNQRCLNCNDYMDLTAEDYCSRSCELEALYTAQCTCPNCGGTGRGRENLKGEWKTCTRCSGTGYWQGDTQ